MPATSSIFPKNKKYIFIPYNIATFKEKGNKEINSTHRKERVLFKGNQ